MWKSTVGDASGASTADALGGTPFIRHSFSHMYAHERLSFLTGTQAGILVTVGYLCGVFGKLENERSVT